MSMGGWLRIHRRGVTTHTLIVVGFLFFLLFLAEPLFDRLERIPYESRLHEAAIPTQTNDIQYWIDQCGATTHTLEITGWAFIEGHDSVDSEVYIVLKSARRTYIFDTMAQERPDATAHFEETGLNLDYSGFAALIPARKIANGEYTIGIYIRKGDVEALQYIDKAMVKSKGTVEIIG